MKVSKLIFVLGVITASGLSTVAIADGHKADGRHEERHMQQMPMQRMLAGLELTDSQQAQIKQLMQQHRQVRRATDEKGETRRQMRELLAAEQFDETAARLLLEQQQQQVLTQRLAGLKLQHQILQLLTEEQRQQLGEKRAKWQQKKLRHNS
ncbi:Spy/CpxP family protein refolding chaperone [Rheinheimera sp. YQF-2]|uniref:Spy/CpxP family protein refolding chaperone n=1 Tax=Rheinheimera lutimaris TaxID=2740584 RepID=A0A7Y5AMH0_9GAMM|nr:Spy/CpxP family protein refolding chaperone [Rheinheimera lutimaris]NRQ41062.1 Spy/CpxP family protein refolding chaperone [Rheinheimera lutimaris]